MRPIEGFFSVQGIVSERFMVEADRGDVAADYRRLAAELSAEHERLVAAQAVAKVGSWEIDLETGTVQWSLETFRIFGEDPAAFQPSPTVFRDYALMHDRGCVDAAFAASFATRETCNVEHRIVLRDGTVKHVEERWNTFVTPGGQPLRAGGTCQDITERRTAEAEAERSQMLLRVGSKLGRLGAWSLDLTEQSMRWSDEVRAIYGIEYDETPSFLDVLPFYTPECQERVRTVFLACVYSGTPWDEELEIVRPDGRHLWVRLIGEAVRNASGRTLTINGAVQDITDRREARAALYDSDERFRSAFEQSMIGMSLTGFDGRLLKVNAALCEMLDRTEEELLSINFVEITHPDDLPENMARVKELVAGVRSRCRMEKRFRRPDGSYIWVDLCVSRVAESRGRAPYVVAQITDISARRAAEDALRDREDEIRHLQKMEAVGRLAGGVAHDFNNLLTVINVHNAFLMESLEETDPRREDAEAIGKAGIRAAGLTRQLLAFSRKQILKTTVLDINAIVHESQKMLRRLLGEDIEIDTILAGDLGRVVADASQVEQVLMNLALNARDAMPDGGQLTIATRSATVTDGDTSPRAIPAGDYAVIEVTDTGTGMDAATQARAFEPFFTTKEQGKGTGLGLATVYGIVTQSAGHVLLKSARGAGTTFEVYLPVASAAEGVVERRAAKDAPPRGAETVLLVEDEPAVRAIARRLLERQGYRVLEAGNGADALAVAAGYGSRIHLVVSDAVMPGMSGAEVTRRLQEERPGIKVLLMSGYTEDEVMRRGILSASVPFVQKPFVLAEFAQAVRDAIGSTDFAPPADSASRPLG